MGNCVKPSTGRRKPSQNVQEPRTSEGVQPLESSQQRLPRRADQSPQNPQQRPRRAETPRSPQQPAAGGILSNTWGESAQPRAGEERRTPSFEASSSNIPSSSSSPVQSEPSDSAIISSSPQSFPFNELKAATENFAASRVVGEGGFGKVYKGWVHEQTRTAAIPPFGTAVAVKVLDSSGLQGEKEWQKEIEHLGKLQHPNLVRLVGYCSVGDDDRLIVYEYLKNGSLEKHLFDDERKLPSGKFREPLSWQVRVHIATGVARGLAYLHGLEPAVISRDIKPANILLDDEFNPRISDFGLARYGPAGDKSHVSTNVMGTFGYAAPEYFVSGKLTTSCDVFSFGVVLVELLTGRRCVDRSRPREQEILLLWALPRMRNKSLLHRIMDLNLQGAYKIDTAYAISHIARLCVQENDKARPPMSDVYQALLWLLQHPNSNPDVPPLPEALSMTVAGIPVSGFYPDPS